MPLDVFFPQLPIASAGVRGVVVVCALLMHGFGHGLAEFAYSGVMGGHSSSRVVRYVVMRSCFQ